jgi:predicted protein tyrosine phosphatase
MNILFVCSRNKWRSLTAETIYKNHALHEIRSAGTSASARIKVNSKLINWATLIFVMETEHKKRLKENFLEELQGKDVIILEIPDEYQYMDEDLILELKNKVDPYL